MSAALLLWAYALLLATVGATALHRAAWPDRAPRVGIATWQALSASIVLAVAFGGLALVVPTSRVSTSLAELIEACAMAIRAQYATPAGSAVATSGLALAAVVVGRWAYCSAVELADSAALRRRHHATLRMVGRLDPELGVTLLEYDQPVVYCLAGRPHRIVLTTGAADALDNAQLSAVLAHERGHLRGRHHLAIAGAAALTRAFPWARVFRDARDEITRLVELLADDFATRAASRLTLAEAMLNLAAEAPSVAALGAIESTAAMSVGPTEAAGTRRIHRLVAAPHPLGAVGSTVGLVMAAALLIVPALVLAAPGAGAGTDCCTPDQPPAAIAAPCATANRHLDCP